jgi:Cof subfamily protein (haloacid dehalogenase superfamily)
MSHTYKLLLLDLDGTTVDSSGEALPTQAVIDAVSAAQKVLQVAVATGRPLPFAKMVTDTLALKGPSVFNGGAEIIDLPSGKVLERQLISVRTLRELTKLALPFGFKIYLDSDQYSSSLTAPEEIKVPAAKLFIEAVPTQKAINLLTELAAVEEAAAHPTTSWDKGDVVDIHITHEHATKRYGVEKLMSILNIKKEAVIAIGDSHNDIPLLEAAGFKVAMGNAPAEVKAIADYVAPSLDEDGVADAISKFILNER